MKRIAAALLAMAALAFPAAAGAASCGWSTDGAWHYSPAYSNNWWAVSYAYYGHQWDGWHNNRLFLVWHFDRVGASNNSYYDWQVVYCG